MKRALFVVGALIVAIPLAAIVAAAMFLNGDAIKVRLAEQVRRSTGRELTIAGPVSLAWSLSPTISLADLSLANPAGFAQPRMAHVDRVDVQLALAPLFRREVAVTRIVVASPLVRLERDAAGRPNWEFRPPAAPVGEPSTASPPASEPFKLAIGAIDITNASIAYGTQTVTAPHLAYDPLDGHVEGTLATAGTVLALSGTAGPIVETAYPLDLHLTGGGATAALTGTSAAATLMLTAPDLAALSPLAGRPLPSVRDVTIATAFPGPSALRIHAGALSVGTLTLQQADLVAASLTGPATLTATAAAGALPLSISGHLGSIAGLLGGPTPIDARIEASGVVGTAVGTMALNGAGEGSLTVVVPNLAAAGARAGVALPELRDLNLTTRLSVAPGSAGFTDLHLTSAQGDLSGTLTLTTAGRPALRGVLTSISFDLDALRVTPLPTSAVAAPSGPAAALPQPVRLIPDSKLPLAVLRSADADLQLNATTLRLSGVELHAVQAHAVMQDGTLRLDPVTTTIGAATARATVELAARPAALHVTIDAPALPFGPISALAGGAATAPGTLDVRADLTGTGDTLRAVAATLTGHAGLALVDAQLDNAVLERLAAGPLRAANLSLEGGGTTVRCAALRADSVAGHVDLRALTLDTSKFALDGSGSLNLADETLDLHLRPELRLGGGLSVPVRVRGTFVAPKVALDPGAIASGRVGIVLGGAPPPDTCGPALALARDGNPGAAAAPPAPTKPIKPADLLRGLLR